MVGSKERKESLGIKRRGNMNQNEATGEQGQAKVVGLEQDEK